MNVFELTRALIDIESISGNEEAVARYLYAYLSPLVAQYDGAIELLEVEPDRFNLFARWGDRVDVTLSTHLDTVPPFFPSTEDAEFIHGRGACDVKGIIACMIKATEALLETGQRNFALLFVIGEERSSAGAYHASANPRGSRYIINGEPTENHLALGSKGVLRYTLKTSGKMAHSAYPELGESAIEKLLDCLQAVRAVALPTDARLGPSTLNIGVISGGRAPNVIPDEASAELMIRLVGDSAPTKAAFEQAVAGRGELEFALEIPALHLGAIDGIPTTVVAFTTDIPCFKGAWGQPFLIGPGTIHVAHTLEERVPKRQLIEAVEIYQRMVKELCNRASK
ncbi:MAG TPA: M20/M25/M40 family metallo-hydrolase [Bryobacteraceae bacterium]|jgi:acetylornithine deacetylase|nr:M20/M25/M40 family metallo-hydrolase [Bryobacteraceae bacterium]